MLADDDVHLRAIKRFYGDRRAERSQLPLINHVVDGLAILDVLDASDVERVNAQRAFCLHPIVQADVDLRAAFAPGGALVEESAVDTFALVLALEYRRCANGHLSRHPPESLDTLSLEPFREVSLMLIADKVQNRRDFERHHAKTHPRAAELAAYFKRWLERLGVDEERYVELVERIGGR